MDCGFVQPSMLMFNIHFPGKEEKRHIAGVSGAAQDGACHSSSILTASAAAMSDRQTALLGQAQTEEHRTGATAHPTNTPEEDVQ